MIGYLTRQCIPASPHRRPSLLARLFAMDSTFRERRSLRAMEAHRLRDTGLTETDAAIESSKPVWNVPHHWMR